MGLGMKFLKTQFPLMLSILFGGFVSIAQAQEWDNTGKDLVQSRNYVGTFFSYMNINNWGDINGTEVNWNPASSSYEFSLIPGVNDGLGFGGLIGHREGAYALEASYWQSQHSAYWAAGTAFAGAGSATYQSIDANFKGYLFTEQ